MAPVPRFHIPTSCFDSRLGCCEEVDEVLIRELSRRSGAVGMSWERQTVCIDTII